MEKGISNSHLHIILNTSLMLKKKSTSPEFVYKILIKRKKED